MTFLCPILLLFSSVPEMLPEWEGVNKILMPLGQTAVIGVCMSAFQNCPDIAEIIVVTKPENFQPIQEIADSLNISKLTHLTEGGDTRQQSVLKV